MHYIFDLHRTLITTKMSHGQFFQSHFNSLDLNLFEIELAKIMRALEQDPSDREIIWQLNGANNASSCQKWCEILVEAILATGYQAPESELWPICKASYDRLSNPSEWLCFDDTHKTLKKLVNAGNTISILSNFDYRGEKIVNELLVNHPWLRMDFSFVTGLLKPEEGAFISHCRVLGILPHNAIMVGDDPIQDGSSQKIGLAFKRVEYPAQPLFAVLFESRGE